MATFDELIEDRTQFPDDTKITIQGTEVTLGSIRGGYMKDADYRRKGSKLADERRRLEQDRVALEADKLTAEQKLTELARETLGRLPGAPQQIVDDELADNPAAQKLMKEIDYLRSEQEKLGKTLQQTQQEIQGQRQERVVEQHQRVLSVLKAHDPTLDTQELIDFCQREHEPRLDHGYRLMTEQKRFKSAVDRAKQEGLEEGVKRGKQEAVQTSIPQRRLVTTLLPEKAPQTFDEAAVAAENDPEIANLLAGQG